MKKVWVLEKWQDREAAIKTVESVLELLDKMEEEYGPSEDVDRIRSESIKKLTNDYNESFNGKWVGHIGRSIYKQFCEDAIECLRYEHNKNSKFRVVSALIDDDATEWVNYVNPVENDGVMKYLYVRLRNY